MEILKRLRQAPASAAAPSSRPTMPVRGNRESTTMGHRRNPAQQIEVPHDIANTRPGVHQLAATRRCYRGSRSRTWNARLTEICLSAYGELAAAQFQITQLRARIHVLAASGP